MISLLTKIKSGIVAPAMGANAVNNQAVRERLKSLREAYRIESQEKMADRLSIPSDRYNSAERPKGNGLSLEVAIRICERFPGVTLDWLFLGKTALLPFDLANALGGRPIGSEPPSTMAKGKRSGVGAK